ncbi:MAG: UDP-N-acetylmuramate dehydrogenase [Pseudomonadota bacterium]
MQPPDFIRKNYPLLAASRMRTGGHALYYAAVETLNQLKTAVGFAHEQGVPFYVLGKGANALISDDDFRGVVIKLAGDFTAISFDSEGRTVTAGGGALLLKLGNLLGKKGYMGCTYMGVIPGTIGGAVKMNAGTEPEQEIKKDFLSALLFDPQTCSTFAYTKELMGFEYRQSILSKSRKIVLEATFTLPAHRETRRHEARDAIIGLLKQRRLRHPGNPHTFGSTFRNPHNHLHSAGWYLEQAGMKGLRIGGAMVALEHANWILNLGNAKSSDIKKIIEIGQERVFAESGIALEREVVYLPDDVAAWI